ncbi:hypothetical protein SAMN05216389_10729 [Oceanobacillus limi]|uniref:Uncharacterized protein n=1 Tax=Oceanobacillus limi TaxID=930131 RepID=A0A1I0CQF6_9BACI|nr:hypothetical protein [Oceanobacillus limi]SET21969.1 hypothetical protein SAMN05216389_10729 [Oceanobacillus limi]
MRNVRSAEKFLLIGYSIVLLFMLLHDWVPLGPLNDVEAIKAAKSSGELVTTTLIGVIQIVLLMTIILIYIGRKYPLWIKLWLMIHPSCIFIGAILSWWVPYLFGIGAEVKVADYTLMFSNTHSFLPVMNGIVPNTIHLIFHLSLFLCICITIYLNMTQNKIKKIQRDSIA